MARVNPHGAYPPDWAAIAVEVKHDAGNKCVRCDHPHDVESHHVLTVHHFDGNRCNCDRWNLMALCQRCHLSIQSRVNPRMPYLFEPSIWIMPYIAGFYEATPGAAVSRLYDLREWVTAYESTGRAWPLWAVRPNKRKG